jgi:hypothetical protein
LVAFSSLLLLILSNAWYNSILNSDTPCTSMAPPSTKLKGTRDDGPVILKLLGLLKIWYVCMCLSSLCVSLSLSHTPTPSFYSLLIDFLSRKLWDLLRGARERRWKPRLTRDWVIAGGLVAPGCEVAFPCGALRVEIQDHAF